MAGQDGPTTGDFAMVPEEVTDAGRYVQQIADSLINGLAALDRDIAALFIHWKGTSAESFAAGWAETKQGADTILEALADMAELLGVTSRTLDDQDRVLAGTTHTLASSLNLHGL
ncbi:WXG100 family type VII secretion target [Nocardia cyriacigeorgica]|uniref:WXG100 family type VII secretion target n=1 Tax=Nocardia cyriacigeorgica TaxID=135487 RepID=UPI0018961E32|nr:WXG100 family type VII secretion target [Nocardia cyriacigeorgica]MBF6088098.1 WXG100 family type VII secretion target [Nocardia cyriacigeorgica]MBF6095207.1 WXG100 family type VII secretion target [Nocardia cyriacigeorgica]MBF6096742.1 WXG100 family type VII secretion target [Nocardia cyriacigeorgica]MBF6162636.1 WXG100 family type VII secretion target [Nocardia cyriacigeorgica]MBF6198095.1 WXG100 family type VII secretion target [Nocardia cyriacigeorgica]